LSKFTRTQKEDFKQLVLHSIIQRLTTEESLLYIKDKLELKVSKDYFNHVRASLKRDVEKDLKHMQKDRFAYIQIYFDRVEEVKYIQRKLWQIVNQNEDKPNLQISCLSELHQLTVSLANLYDILPAIVQVKPFGNENENLGYEDKSKHRLGECPQ
jgi:hypothetical protein